ncbi:ketopantoate reductase family protein [Christiangramia flava]|uniref:2-dehydropantoate 2-reductase n=1 Tax=Christiangramia flava JLT2011 TaxID=1229726 RepID=A0A1L7I0J6_9FLAO|nr:2-dehydropantoate 2-reductase [Christiangramia flava]APU67117.1 2-dehydropantoate 2-reductase [Christiangramia flava JLT2011]OSS38111.1 2-dehydropantoate 2-reductase [Christiangramia flava JLT2011]
MNILVYGIGGVGGYFGAKLATTEHHITFIARGAHMEAIIRNGISVNSILGDFHSHPNLVTDDLNEIQAPDLVIFGVKSWQLADAAKNLKPYVKPDTIFLPLQNGVRNSEILIEYFSSQQILGGLCNLISYIEAPGVIQHTDFVPTITFGELTKKKTKRLKALSKLFDQADIKNIIAEDIQREIWKKFLFICTISGLGGLTRVPIGKMRDSRYLSEIMKNTANEILFLAQAKGINLSTDDVAKVFKIIADQDPESTASTQRDLMNGRPSELETFNGYVVHEAQKENISVPVNTFIYECLSPMERMAREKTPS